MLDTTLITRDKAKRVFTPGMWAVRGAVASWMTPSKRERPCTCFAGAIAMEFGKISHLDLVERLTYDVDIPRVLGPIIDVPEAVIVAMVTGWEFMQSEVEFLWHPELRRLCDEARSLRGILRPPIYKSTEFVPRSAMPGSRRMRYPVESRYYTEDYMP